MNLGGVDCRSLRDQLVAERAEKAGTNPKSAAWREMVGFDNIMSSADLRKEPVL